MNGIPPYSSYQSPSETEQRTQAKQPQELPPPPGEEKLAPPEKLPPPREEPEKK